MYPASPSLTSVVAPVFGAIEDAAASLASVMSSTGPRGFAALPRPAAAATDLGYFGSRRLLADAGVRFPPAVEVSTVDELRAAAVAIGGPFVLKALHLLHKSDAGGVRVGLRDVDALVAAHADMHARLGAPSYSVEAMADGTDGIELIVGVNVRSEIRAGGDGRSRWRVRRGLPRRRVRAGARTR